MGDFKVRRSTAALLTLCGALTVACFALAVALSFHVPSCVDNSNSSHNNADSSSQRNDNSAGSASSKKVNPASSKSTTAVSAPTTKTSMASQPKKEQWETEYRLPRDALPLHYNVHLHPDLQAGLFSGQVDIELNVTHPRDFLLAHVKNLTVTATEIHSGKLEEGQESVAVASAFEYAKNEFWVTKLAQPLEPGIYTLSLKFQGNLTSSIVGFYKSVYYNDQTNQSRAIATSKFEPTYARRAFPCLDEPSFKSTFTVSLVRPSGDGYIALSNMPVSSETENSPRPGLTTVSFEKSVPMVTYLACFIVCDFRAVESKTKSGTPMRVFATPNQMDGTAYPLDVGIKSMFYLEDYFGIPYALPKQDLIAIPDFVSGAMEHWGLVTFRETALLYDPKKSSIGNQKRVATVVAHELVHQWFGNYMTVRWWDDLWLNEGFASYIEYKAVHYCEPTWDIETQMLVDDVQPVLELDAKLSSHPIVQPVNHPDEITEIFDSISYKKGASVLRMLESFMGSEKFRMGVHNFLKKYAFENAETKDLWDELQTVQTNLNITRIMDTWTRQMGYPVLSFQKSNNGRTYTVYQTRFLADPSAANPTKQTTSPYGYKWEVPITYITDRNLNEPRTIWLHMEDTSIEIDVPEGATWIKFNVRQNGFYRVNYLPEDWHALSDILRKQHNLLSPADRSGLLDDVFNLADAGLTPFSIALNISLYLEKETHAVPWDSASSKLRGILHLLDSSPVYPRFRKFLLSIVKEPFAMLGWEDKGEFLDKMLRSTVVHLACEVGYEPCLEGALEKLNKWIKDSSFDLPPNIRSLVYRYGMAKSTDPHVWETMWSRYLAEPNAQEKVRLMQALAYTKEPWLINQYLNLAKNPSFIRSQDFFLALQYMADNPVGQPIVWDFIRSEWEYLVDRFTLNDRNLGRLVMYVSSGFTTKAKLKEIEYFFTEYPEAGAGARARQQALETVHNNIRWLQKNEKSVSSWLEEHGFV